MIWPPPKAWTSKSRIFGQVHFVAINYGGKSQDRWVILMSVIDSSIVVKVYWKSLVDLAEWKSGWNEINIKRSSKLDDNKSNLRTTKLTHLSPDSGLTIPITKCNIRPWFEKK